MGKFVHGMAHTRIYTIYKGMWTRCENRKDKFNYPKYGARGIRVCKEWHDFLSFYEDMKGSYFEGAQIDRIDNSKGYSKENCRWVTTIGQSRNKTNNRLITYKGKTLCATDWSKKLGIGYATILARIDRGWSVEDSLSLAVMKPHYYKKIKALLD